MFFDVARLVERSVLPFLPHADGGDGVVFVNHFYVHDFVVGYRTAVAGDEIVEPFVVHGLEFGQVVEHRVQRGIEVRRHISARLLPQLVVGDIPAQLFSAPLQFFFVACACRQNDGGERDCDDLFHYSF